MEEPETLPEMPRPGGRGHALESLASMIWTLTYLAYSSSTVVSEFGTGVAAAWTLLLVSGPAVFAGADPILSAVPGAVSAMIRYVVFACTPGLVQLARPARGGIIALLCDVAAVAALWLPLELRTLPQLGPTGTVSIWPMLVSSLSALNTFLVIRPFEQPGRTVGYTFKLGLADITAALGMALIASIIAVALAAALGYGHLWRPRGLKREVQFAVFLGVYFTALSEEVLFRGIVQNLLERWLQAFDALLPILIAAGLYGTAHLKSKARGFKPPNWRAAVMSAVTGISYGFVWRWTGKSTASALTHAVVEYVLRTLFEKTNTA